MKKSKLSIGLVTTFIAALGLSACNTTSSAVTDGKGAIVTITGYGGEKIEIKANDLYGEYLKDPNKISSFYSTVEENLIRYTYEKTTFVSDNNSQPEEPGKVKVTLKTYNGIKSDADLAVRKAKEKAQANAKSSGTSFQTEWDKILKENNVENEEELREKYIYQYEKEEYENWYLKTNMSSLTNEYITDSSVKADAKFPYHIRHILISLSNGSSDFVKGTISEDEADTLGSVMSELIDSTKVGGSNSYLYTFAKIAREHADKGDSGSAAKGGDVGIMSTTTSFVNEFKLGIYAYDTVFNNVSTRSAETVKKVKEGLGITSEVENSLKTFGLEEVPYDAFIQIGLNKDVTTDENKDTVNDNNEAYYPRNVYYNNYLNLHRPFVITNQKLDPKTGRVSEETIKDSSRFGYVASEKLRYLTDEEGRVIIGVRSEHGIHLMIMQKSIFNDETTYTEKAKQVSLKDYYTTYTPDNKYYPTFDQDGEKKPYTTYVNYLPGLESTDLKTRASEVEGEISGFDNAYSYRVYENLLNYLSTKSVTVTFSKGIDETIDGYISTLRQKNKWDRADSLKDAWKTYLNLLELELYTHGIKFGSAMNIYDTDNVSFETSQNSRRVNTVCAVSFKKAASSKNYEKGGVCYEAK